MNQEKIAIIERKLQVIVIKDLLQYLNQNIEITNQNQKKLLEEEIKKD